MLLRSLIHIHVMYVGILSRFRVLVSTFIISGSLQKFVHIAALSFSAKT